MLALMANANFRHWENSFYQREEGWYSEGQFEGEAEAIRSMLAEQNHAEHWACSRQTYARAFRDFVDSLVDAGSCPENFVLNALAAPYVVVDREIVNDRTEE